MYKDFFTDNNLLKILIPKYSVEKILYCIDVLQIYHLEKCEILTLPIYSQNVRYARTTFTDKRFLKTLISEYSIQ